MSIIDGFRNLFPDIDGHKNTPPAWIKKPGPPWQVRDAPCGRAPAGLFELDMRKLRRSPTEKMEHQYQIAKATRICNGAPGYDDPCPAREVCLLWALNVGSTGIFGGVVVTPKMIEDRKKEVARAAQEASAPKDESGELAERLRETV